LIEMTGLTYHYPGRETPALSAVNLRVSTGEFLLVIGSSGSGKSSLLRCLNGLVPHFYGGTLRGSVRVAGRDPVALGPAGLSDLVGFVAQDPEAHFVAARVEDELAFAMENRSLPQTLMRKRIEEVLDQLSIAHLRQRRIDTLSGGEQQRVAIGSVLTLEPAILVLDEPTSQLDPQGAEEVLNTLRQLNEDLGLTVVLSEHRLERVAHYADRICLLRAGHPPIVASAREVLAESEQVPPLVSLGRKLGWEPLPLTIKEARSHIPELLSRLASCGGSPPSSSTARGRAVISTRGVWHSYDRLEALRGVDLEIRAGERVALMGRNGSGKSTLLKMLVGLLKPQRGHVEILGRALEELPLAEVTRQVGFVPQNPGRLLFRDTVVDEVRFTRKAHGLPATDMADLLNRLGLSAQAGSYPRDLSSGERQRAALAAILAAEPEILLLDEPTRGLDDASKEQLRAILEELSARDVTTILATHDVELVARFAQRVVLLGEGEVVVDGPVREVMTASAVFASQVNKLLRDERFLTVDDVLDCLAHA
jgi:energy-coupling factor transport system ATP-binding protein